MSDFTDSLKDDNDTEVKLFILELFDRINHEHTIARHEFEQAYYQGQKDALRKVLAYMTGRDVDLISSSSIVAYKLRGNIPLDNGEILK